MTALLKNISSGKTVTMMISRLPEDEHGEPPPVAEKSGALFKPALAGMEASLREELSKLRSDRELIAYDIALNDSPSAGLGVSLNAQKTYDDEGNARDSGLYIRNVRSLSCEGTTQRRRF